MALMTRRHLADIRGAGRLLLDASTGLVDVAERVHRTIQRRPAAVGQPVLETTQGITGSVYRGVRRGMQFLGRGLDSSLVPLEELLPEGQTTPQRDVFISVLNGVYGDYLARTGNPLAIGMHLRHDGVTVDAANPAVHLDGRGRPALTGKILVLVHGLCMSDQQWTHENYSHGAALAEEFGYRPLYLRYNSGLHVAENGRQFAEMLETLLGSWPQPVEQLVIIGHSMGGLVARAACIVAAEQRHIWPKQLCQLVFLGTPHHGAPLERGGRGLDFLLDLSPYTAPFTLLGKARSAGIQNLRHGTITAGRHTFVPLPTGVNCYAMAGALGARRSLLTDRLVGDGLVPVDSALGRHTDPSCTLRFPKAHRWIGYQMGHLELLHRPEVYSQLRSWLNPVAK